MIVHDLKVVNGEMKPVAVESAINHPAQDPAYLALIPGPQSPFQDGGVMVGAYQVRELVQGVEDLNVLPYHQDLGQNAVVHPKVHRDVREIQEYQNQAESSVQRDDVRKDWDDEAMTTPF